MRYLVLIAAVFCCAIAQASDAPKPEKVTVVEFNAITAEQAPCCPTCRPTPVRNAIAHVAAKIKAHACKPQCCPEPCVEVVVNCPPPKPEPECCEPDPCCRPRLLQRIKARIKARRCCCPPPTCCK